MRGQRRRRRGRLASPLGRQSGRTVDRVELCALEEAVLLVRSALCGAPPRPGEGFVPCERAVLALAATWRVCGRARCACAELASAGRACPGRLVESEAGRRCRWSRRRRLDEAHPARGRGTATRACWCRRADGSSCWVTQASAGRRRRTAQGVGAWRARAGRSGGRRGRGRRRERGEEGQRAGQRAAHCARGPRGAPHLVFQSVAVPSKRAT